MRSIVNFLPPNATSHFQKLIPSFSRWCPSKAKAGNFTKTTATSAPHQHHRTSQETNPARLLQNIAAAPTKGTEVFTRAQAHDCAEQATLKSFLNCYMREIAAGVVLPVQSAGKTAPQELLFELPKSFAKLRVAIRYWSLSGPHDFGDLHLSNAETGNWRRASICEVLPMLVRECFSRTASDGGYKMPELLRRVLNSYDQIGKCSDTCQPDPKARRDFLTAEQSLNFGHWLHPTPKSREGMTDWHQTIYAPEFGGQFQLQYFAAHESIAITGTAEGPDARDLVAQIPGLNIKEFNLRSDEILIPMHPLQADALRLQPAIKQLMDRDQLRDLGPAGCTFCATSSVRTVYSETCPWMFKFSLPVKITNSHRVNLHHELEAGVVMARVLRKTGFLDSQSKFRVINDPAFLSIDLPGQRESGFEVILRENPFMGTKQQGVVNIAALTSDPLPGQTSLLAEVIHEMSERQNRPSSEVAAQWFDAYLDCALHPALELYDRFGIALEAHQQNSLLDISKGLPKHYYFRDNQGYYISEGYIDKLTKLEPDLRDIDAVCFPQDEINERFCYYLIVNQVFSVISRLGRDGFLSETALLELLRDALQTAAKNHDGAAKEFANYLLTSPELASKANLLTRVHDMDELQVDGEKAVYVKLKNPIVRPVPAQAQEVRNVVA